MAVYILADIHGMYDKFIRMLDKINMTDEDILYVLGDMVRQRSTSDKGRSENNEYEKCEDAYRQS